MLSVSNLNKAIPLYLCLLKGTLLYHHEHEALLEIDKFRLRLLETHAPHEPAIIPVSVEDLGDTAKHLLKCGAALQRPVDLAQEVEDSHVPFVDPDGNRIVIMGPNRDHISDTELLSLLTSIE